MNVYHIAWLVWAGCFFVIEFAALIFHRGQGDTLSECVWKIFAITGKNHAFWRLRRFMLLALLAWIVAHFLSGGQF